MTDVTVQIVVYTDPDGNVRAQVRLEEGSVWLSQAQMAELYGTTPQNITQHVRAIYDEGEQDAEATCKPYLQVQSEGSRRVSRVIKHYSLAMILAVGFRVRSPVGTRFRQWATGVLAEFAVKGFSMDDRRLRAAGSDDHLVRVSANATEHPPILQRKLAGPVIEVNNGRYHLGAAEVAGAHRTGRTFARNRREAPHGA